MSSASSEGWTVVLNTMRDFNLEMNLFDPEKIVPCMIGTIAQPVDDGEVLS